MMACTCPIYPNMSRGPNGSAQQQLHKTTIDNYMLDTNTHSHLSLHINYDIKQQLITTFLTHKHVSKS